MFLDIIKTLPPIIAGIVALGLAALQIVSVVLLYKIYKNTKPTQSLKEDEQK